MENQRYGRNTRPVDPNLFGLLLDVPYEAYAQADAINAHGLMDILDSPAAYKYRLDHPGEPSTAMQLGTLLDMALLEPERFARTVVAGDRRKVKAEPGQTVITPAVHEKIQGMLAGIVGNPIAAQLIESQEFAQSTIYWEDPVHRVVCKARPDLTVRLGGRTVACDLKTAADASPRAFARAAANFNYDLQMAHYLEAGRSTMIYDHDLFLFIVVQTSPPFPCYVYQAGDTWFSRGRFNRDHAMQLYARCRAANEWPAPAAFQVLELPAWAKPVEEDDPPEAAPEMPDIDLDQV